MSSSLKHASIYQSIDMPDPYINNQKLGFYRKIIINMPCPLHMNICDSRYEKVAKSFDKRFSEEFCIE